MMYHVVAVQCYLILRTVVDANRDRPLAFASSALKLVQNQVVIAQRTD